MADSTRRVSVRLSLDDAARVKQELREVGETGQRSLERIQGGADRASRALDLLDGAVRGVQIAGLAAGLRGGRGRRCARPVAGAAGGGGYRAGRTQLPPARRAADAKAGLTSRIRQAKTGATALSPAIGASQRSSGTLCAPEARDSGGAQDSRLFRGPSPSVSAFGVRRSAHGCGSRAWRRALHPFSPRSWQLS